MSKKTENHEEASNPNSNTHKVVVPIGRTRRVKNALAHGLYASDIVLPWESELPSAPL